MAVGLIIPNMDMYGLLVTGIVVSILIDRVDIGYGQIIMNGCGSPIMIGGGRHFTMAGGCTILFMDGYGYRVMIGRPHG